MLHLCLKTSQGPEIHLVMFSLKIISSTSSQFCHSRNSRTSSVRKYLSITYTLLPPKTNTIKTNNSRRRTHLSSSRRVPYRSTTINAGSRSSSTKWGAGSLPTGQNLWCGTLERCSDLVSNLSSSTWIVSTWWKTWFPRGREWFSYLSTNLLQTSSSCST